jgi:hypothetical protein
MAPTAYNKPSTRQMPEDRYQKVVEFSGNTGLNSGKASALAR